jgi:hypothetical protein
LYRSTSRQRASVISELLIATLSLQQQQQQQQQAQHILSSEVQTSPAAGSAARVAVSSTLPALVMLLCMLAISIPLTQGAFEGRTAVFG